MKNQEKINKDVIWFWILSNLIELEYINIKKSHTSIVNFCLRSQWVKFYPFYILDIEQHLQEIPTLLGQHTVYKYN